MGQRFEMAGGTAVTRRSRGSVRSAGFPAEA
jgi:hypothetical protein